MRQSLLISLLLALAGSASAQLSANFTASPVTGCAPMVVSFSNTSTGSPTGYSWTFGNGLTSTAANPIVPYTVPGTYTVSLTISNASGSNTFTRTSYIIVKQVPAVTFSASPLAICPYSTVNFTSSVTWNATGSGNYYWDFGDGSSSTSSAPAHVYASSGVYTVKLTATNSAGCPTTDTQANLITVYAPPAADFTASDTAICALSGSTTFTSTTTGSGTLSYVWDFGDGSPLSTSAGPVSHAYSAAGSYTVRLIATDGHGCSDTETKANYIRVRVVNAAFTAPATICQGASAAATSTSTTTGGSVSWNFGDGSAPLTGSTAAHTYLVAGTYIITQTVTLGGCTATATSSITVHPKPSSAFTSSPTVPCPAPVQITFASASASGVTYAWAFGDGTSGSGATPAHWYTRDSTFSVTMSAYNTFGCSSTTTGNVSIPPMRADIYYDKKNGCAPLTVHLIDSLETRIGSGWVNYPYASVSSISWNFGDGSTGSGHSPTHLYSIPGTYLVQLTLTTTNGCTVTDTLRIRAGTHPTPAFGAAPRITCVNDPIHFTDSSTSSGLPIDEWLWDFGDGGSSMLQNPTYFYSYPDTFYVTLHVGANGCWDSLRKPAYIIVNYPKSVMRVIVSCDTARLVHFTDNSIGATSHIWYFGDGATSTAANPAHQYASSGLYTASLVSFNSATGCRDSISHSINLNTISIGFTALDTTLCLGDTIRLHATVSGTASATAYSWWMGAGSATPVFSYPGGIANSPNRELITYAGGQFHIALEVQDQNSCKTRLIRNNYITVGAPQVHFRCIPPVGCFPNTTIQFRDTTIYPTGTSGASRAWDFGDGSSSIVPASFTYHTYTSAGSYGIFLKVTDNIGCIDSAYIPNQVVISHPAAFFTTSGTNACVGVPFTFFSSSNGNGLSYYWTFGDGGTSTALSPAHAYASTGIYTIRLVVTDNVGCSDTLTRLNYITVAGRPRASFTMNDTINVCPPLIVNFTNTSTLGAVSYSWSFGNSGVSTLPNPSNTYTTPQVYIIRLVAANAAGCKDTAYGRVRILGYAGVMSYAPLAGCAPLQVNFQANNVDGVSGFIYDFGDGATAATTAKTISHIYTAAGPHVPKIILTDNLGCTASSMGLDTVKVDGVVAGFTFAPFPACDKGTITFIDTSHGVYSALNPGSWAFHDGSTSTLASPSKTYPGPGTYAVTRYSSTVAGCKDTLRSKVVFHPLPVIRAGYDTTICRSDTATFRPSGGVSYAWSPAASLACPSCENPGAHPAVETSYTVIGTDEHGCTGKDTVLVRIRTNTTATVSASTEICAGKFVALHATGGGTYSWTPETGLSDPHIADPIAAPAGTQHYMLITKLAGCIPDTDYVDIVVHPVPQVEAGQNQTMIAGNSVQLSAVGSGFITRWVWSPSDGLSCSDCPSPEASPKRSTDYIITAITEFNCEATDTVRVTVLCDNSQVYLPNTFTPDGNGVNDIFYPRGRGLKTISHFRIYDRWGELVFERTDMAVDNREAGWDGRKAGRLLSPDIYVYVVEAVCDNGEPIKWQGDVMLLR